MNMKYNPWFNEYYRYTKGKRDGIETYNSTRYVDAFERYSKVSDLKGLQQYGIVGNNRGFDKLIELLSKSNYTFEDINDSLIQTYKENLQNAMGRMLTNTHSSIFHCKSTDSKYVTPDVSNVDYRIIDIPFDQLHFGNRDEFIRQKLSKMHHKAYNNFMYINEFTSKEIQDLLGFSIMITTNGRICNDWYVALSDMGFMFKVGWRYSEVCDFIIYMLDDCYTYKLSLDYKEIESGVIDSSHFNSEYKNKQCFVDIFNPIFSATTRSLPAFGVFNNDNKLVMNIQKQHLVELESQKTETATVIVYIFKFLHEVQNLYPAVNYYDIMDGFKVYDEQDNPVYTDDNKRVLSTNNTGNNLEICTPPIILDRPLNLSFDIIKNCLGMKTEMLSYQADITRIGNLLRGTINDDELSEIKRIIGSMYIYIYKDYVALLKGANLTSLIPYEYVLLWKQFMDNLYRLNTATVDTVQNYTFDELYADNYTLLVNKVTSPMENELLQPFQIIPEIEKNFSVFTGNEYKAFNRPVTEELFITLKYSRDENSWLFDYPSIRHFNGISNSFYINEELKGNEIFKFFVLYSDTDNPTDDRIVEPFDFDTVFDFDKFAQEVDKHQSYIRYWHNENKLMKISKMVYDRYDLETTAHILSKILKHKIDGEDMLSQYPSDILYDLAGMSTVTDSYNENSDVAPFTINYLFYTVSMMYENEDKLQQYFFHHLVNDKFLNSYVDMDVKDVITDGKHTNKVNFSVIHKAPNTVDTTASAQPTNANINLYDGLPLGIKNNVNDISNSYRYVFNEYEDDVKYPIIGDSVEEYYLKYSDLSQHDYEAYTYANDARLCSLVSQYVCEAYDVLNELLNDYDKSYHKYKVLDRHKTRLNRVISEIRKYNGKTFMCLDSQTVLNSIITNNTFMTLLDELIEKFTILERCNFEDRNISVTELINKYVLSTIRFVYKTNGFKSEIYPDVRKIYIHLKRLNRKMNLYKYSEWLDGLNSTKIKLMDKYISDNPNYELPQRVFENLATYVGALKVKHGTTITSINQKLNTLSSDTQLSTLKTYINTIRSNYIFDLYCIDNVEITSAATTYSQKPAIGIISTALDSHFVLPTDTFDEDETTSLIFSLDPETAPSSKYSISKINKICEYVMFNDTSIDATMSVQTVQGIQLGNVDVTITFKRVSSSSDIFSSFDQLSYIGQTIIDVENNHDTFEIHNGKVVNNTFANMNYELMIGNKFIPLHHDTEMILHAETFMPGAIDRIQVDNNVVNRFVNDKQSKDVSNNMWFKPSRIIHPETSVNGKYFVGQRVYIKTEDGYTFPCVVTIVDHSQAHGFMEVEVDALNSKWINVTNDTLINKYLNTNVKCSVIDDNISNWLDEYTGDYSTFSSILKSENILYDEEESDYYNLPGDPLFVTNNAPYVYSRIIRNTSEIPQGYERYNIKYLTRSYCSDGKIRIDTINHNFNTLSNAELYPVLREEPNDHKVWATEIGVFESEIKRCDDRIKQYIALRTRYQTEMEKTKKVSKRQSYAFKIESLNMSIESEELQKQKLSDYIRELESPTTWYNVSCYDSAITYIMNGRAVSTMTYHSEDIRDIVYSDKLNVFLYDDTNNCWITDFTVTPETVDNVDFDVNGDYTVNDVLYSLKIELTNVPTNPISVLVYIGYDRSNIFDDNETNENECYASFKPLLSLNKPDEEFDPYKSINIRKHMNGKEVYKYDTLETIDGFEGDCLHIIRPEMDGKYNAPPLRACDITIQNGSNTYDYEDIDLWIQNPFKDTAMNPKFKKLSYSVLINKNVEYLDIVDGDIDVKLICVNANHFNGNISDIIFDATICYYENQQRIVIKDSSLPATATGTYVCTVRKDNDYRPLGGVITVIVASSTTQVLDGYRHWVNIPTDLMKYRIIPNECIITLKSTAAISTADPIYITLKSEYSKDYEDSIESDNSNVYNPYEYYYDTKQNVRYPISHIHTNDVSKRLTIDTDTNTNVKVIKSTYIGVCRYSLQCIPQSGIIDLTGYIPTPLTRERYQFWVNGEDKTNSPDLHILSPSSIQFTDLTSLRNFELIELVYDYDDSIVNFKNNVYMDLNGKTYSSYKLCLKANSPVVKQSLQFVFNMNNHKPLHDYTRGIINNPNNVNVDTDILDYISSEDPTSYSEIHNTPTINGEPLHHPTFTSLGFVESPNIEIINALDNVWKKEIITDPNFCITHRNGVIGIDKAPLILHVRHNVNSTCDDDYYIGYVTGMSDEYLSMYISNNSNDAIYNTENVLRIIGFIRTGIIVYINKSFKGKWLHTTANTDPVIIK